MMASYTKLKDGSWGIRVDGTVAPGSVVTVTKKDGTRNTEKVAKVLWTGNGVALCSIAPKDAKPQSQPSSRSRVAGRKYECPECGDYVFPGTRCWETGCTH